MATVPFQMIPAALRDDIEAFVEHVVDQRLVELFGDPDEGFELREEVVQRLREQQKRVAAGDLGVPYDEVVRRLGLE
ncbi:MAG: hypothetical protein WD669_07510 [Pirellulales bacterium]